MNKVRIAQIGINRYSHATGIFPTLKKLENDFDIAGYVLVEDEEERFADLLSCYDGYPRLKLEEVLNDPTITAVTVETEEIHLTKYALLAAQHGKHIHMEKPGGLDAAAFDALIATVKEHGTVFHTGYMYRYNPYVQELLAQIDRGELGEILYVEAQMNCWHPKGLRQWLSTLPGGMMFFLGCHLVDLIYRIQGMPDEVLPLSAVSGVDGVTAEDEGLAVFRYKHGVSFARTTAVERGGFERRQLVVVGTAGTVALQPLEWYLPDFSAQYTQRYVWMDTDWHIRPTAEACPSFDRYEAMMTAFAAMVRGERENPYTPDYESALYKLVLEACGGYGK